MASSLSVPVFTIAACALGGIAGLLLEQWARKLSQGLSRARGAVPARRATMAAVTAVLFGGVAWTCGPANAGVTVALAVLLSLLVVATFIDLEYLIIPNEVTWGGTLAGVVSSLAVPRLMGVDSRLDAVGWSVGGAAFGYFLLWGVVEGGKKAFGRKRVVLAQPEPFTWVRDGDDAELRVGGKPQRWSELFARESDRLVMEGATAEIAGERWDGATLEFHYNRLRIGERTWPLLEVDRVEGRVAAITFPREAMGFGDVKLIAAIGAFLGWRAAFFTFLAASIVGVVVSVAAIALRRREWSTEIPFGPYLAVGALAWILAGPAILEWYWGLLGIGVE